MLWKHQLLLLVECLVNVGAVSVQYLSVEWRTEVAKYTTLKSTQQNQTGTETSRAVTAFAAYKTAQCRDQGLTVSVGTKKKKKESFNDGFINEPMEFSHYGTMPPSEGHGFSRGHGPDIA